MKALSFLLIFTLAFIVESNQGACMDHVIDLEDIGLKIPKHREPRKPKTTRFGQDNGFEDSDSGEGRDNRQNPHYEVQLTQEQEALYVYDPGDVSSGTDIEDMPPAGSEGPPQSENIWVAVSLVNEGEETLRSQTPDPKEPSPLTELEDLGLRKEELKNTPTALEEFFKGFNWQQPKDSKGRFRTLTPELRSTMIDILRGQPASQLSLNYCDTLDPKLFRQFQIRYITHLTLQGCPWVTGKMVADLPEQCTGLYYFDGSRCYNLDKFAGRFSTLRTLKLNGCFTLKEVSIKAEKPPVELMRKQRRLLQIRYTKLKDNIELDNARKEYGLKHVELKESRSLEKLSIETNSLRTAHFDYTPLVTDIMLDTFAKTCPDLEVLSCEKCPAVNQPDLRKLFPKLVQSNLGNNLGEILKRLHNGKLHYLAFSHLMPPAIRSLPVFNTLSTLIVENSHMTDEGATLISTLPDLHELDLSNNQIGPEGARSLFRHPKIKTLTLNGNNIGNQGIKWLNPNVVIRTLGVGRNNIGNDGLYGLLTSQIEDIDLSSNQITEVGANIIKSMPITHTVNLSHNPIGDNGALSISQMPYLRHLAVKNCQIGD